MSSICKLTGVPMVQVALTPVRCTLSLLLNSAPMAPLETASRVLPNTGTKLRNAARSAIVLSSVRDSESALFLR